MLQALPVTNCLHFLMPVSLDNWKSYDVPGVVGVLRRDDDGNYEVLDAFDCSTIPCARELALDERFGAWAEAAGSRDQVRFDVFLMPKAEEKRRLEVVMLLERSCGFKTAPMHAYAHAV